jgi:Domain of unknown function (DUF2383)
MQTMVPPFSLADPRDGHEEGDESKALMALYDRTVDSVKGYATMVEKAEPAFRDTAERFRALHARHADKLAQLLAEIEAEADGTMMGTVNQAVVTFRAFFDDIDEDVMDQVRSGEDWVLKAFDDAILEQAGVGATDELRLMQAELAGLLAETRHLG